MSDALPVNGQRLSMETIKNIASAVLVVGGLGAFIDFLIGRTGQAKAKDFLLKWWVRFDDVHWKNFGREEGLFAGRLIEKWFGRRIWSLRRIKSSLFVLYLFTLLGFVITFYIGHNQSTECTVCGQGLLYIAAEFLIFLI